MNKNIKGIFFCIFGGCCWGISGVLGKYLFDYKDMSATWLVSLRLLSGGILMLIASKMIGQNIGALWKRKENIKTQLIFSFLGVGFCQMCYFIAIDYSNPATATVIQYVSPFLVMLYSIVRQKRMPSKTEVGVLSVVIFGIFVLTTHLQPGTLSVSGLAIFWSLASAVCYAVNNIAPVELIKEYGTFPVLGWGMVISGIFFCLVNQVWHVTCVVDLMMFLAFGGIVLFGTVIAFSANLYGITLIGSVRGSMFTCVEPVVSCILTVFILHQTFAPADLIGMALIMGSVTVLAKAS